MIIHGFHRPAFFLRIYFIFNTNFLLLFVLSVFSQIEFSIKFKKSFNTFLIEYLDFQKYVLNQFQEQISEWRKFKILKQQSKNGKLQRQLRKQQIEARKKNTGQRVRLNRQKQGIKLNFDDKLSQFNRKEQINNQKINNDTGVDNRQCRQVQTEKINEQKMYKRKYRRERKQKIQIKMGLQRQKVKKIELKQYDYDEMIQKVISKQINSDKQNHIIKSINQYYITKKQFKIKSSNQYQIFIINKQNFMLFNFLIFYISYFIQHLSQNQQYQNFHILSNLININFLKFYNQLSNFHSLQYYRSSFFINFKQVMFLFSCCTSHEGQFSYQIRQDYNKVNNSNSATNLQQKINNSKQYVIKVKKSKLQNISSNNKQKSKDLSFMPSKQSLGQIPNLLTCNWKRLSQIVPHPTLFTTNKLKVPPKSKQSFTGQYFLSAVQAIILQPKRIKDIFVSQQISKNGIYLVKLRVNGQIQQVAIDDYVPVNELGQPIFSPPYQSQIWVPLLEKAWAKVNKSYANIINGTSAQVFKAFNFAPSQVFYLEDKQQKKQKLWKLLTQAAKRKSPVSCLSSHNESVDWIHINLIPNCHYNLIYAAQVYQKDKKSYRIVKLRNTNAQSNWQGKGSYNDTQFWSDTLASQQKIKLLQHYNQKQGQLIMLYTDFVKYFSQINISYQLQQGIYIYYFRYNYLQDQGNFIWEQIFFNHKNGSLWEIDVTHQGQYSFQLHQQSLRNQSDHVKQNNYARSTIILAKILQQNNTINYQYLAGSMRFTQQDALVNAFLKQGKYIIYAKIQYGNKSQSNKIKSLSQQNNKSSISVYSNKLCKFKLLQKKNYPNLLQNIFLNYGRNNKRQQYNRQKMWLSWKLLFKQCGFAYIAFGNAKDSDKKFTIKFQSKDFEQMHFKLKSPYKANKNKQNTVYQIQVLPGQQKIILARIFNNRVTTLKFPPPIEMKIQQLHNK